MVSWLCCFGACGESEHHGREHVVEQKHLKADKWGNYIKLIGFCTTKETRDSLRIGRQYLATISPTRGLISKLYKELKEPNNEKQIIQLKSEPTI
jgi:hypothetical protein